MDLTLTNDEIKFKMLIKKDVLWNPRHFRWDGKPMALFKSQHWAVSPAGEIQGVQLKRSLLSSQVKMVFMVL